MLYFSLYDILLLIEVFWFFGIFDRGYFWNRRGILRKTNKQKKKKKKKKKKKGVLDVKF